MPELGSTVLALLVLGLVPVTGMGGDLSRYRDFQLGATPATVARQTGTGAVAPEKTHRGSAHIQELEWHPQPLGWSAKTEPAQKVTFSFYDGELFRIAVDYDRFETEGLTTADIVAGVSVIYGVAEVPSAPPGAGLRHAGDREEVVARWQDPQFRFELVRSSDGPSFKLVGVLRRLESAAGAALVEARRLHDLEAPQRAAARREDERAAERARLEQSRLVNKPKFRP
jgi:hypothetical protein